MSNAERQKRYRDRKRGAPPRELEPCGTRAAATRHRRAGEPLCDACIEAEREYQRKPSSRTVVAWAQRFGSLSIGVRSAIITGLVVVVLGVGAGVSLYSEFTSTPETYGITCELVERKVEMVGEFNAHRDFTEQLEADHSPSASSAIAYDRMRRCGY